MSDVVFTVSDLATEWREKDRLVGCVLPMEQVIEACVAATRFYAGHGYIAILVPPPPPEPPRQCHQPLEWIAENYLDGIFGVLGYDYGFPLFLPQPPKLKPGSAIAPVDWIDDTTALAQSEWSVIRPLFILYVERENALYQEASRQAGLEVYGRSSSEIAIDIERVEADIPHRAASQPIFSI
jgi:hypothetical protein